MAASRNGNQQTIQTKIKDCSSQYICLYLFLFLSRVCCLLVLAFGLTSFASLFPASLPPSCTHFFASMLLLPCCSISAYEKETSTDSAFLVAFTSPLCLSLFFVKVAGTYERAAAQLSQLEARSPVANVAQGMTWTKWDSK